MNVENIKLVRNHIAGLSPSRFNMAEWSAPNANDFEDIEPVQLLHDCDTAGCIGGYTNALFGHEMNEAKAAAALGLDEERASELFRPEGVDLAAITLDDAVRCLDQLLATGEVDWTRQAEAVAA